VGDMILNCHLTPEMTAYSPLIARDTEHRHANCHLAIHIRIYVCIANVDRFCAFLLCYLDGARPQLLAGSVRYDFKLSSHARDDSLQPAHSKGYRASARKLSSRAR
jgi:hypothetical protein